MPVESASDQAVLKFDFAFVTQETYNSGKLKVLATSTTTAWANVACAMLSQSSCAAFAFCTMSVHCLQEPPSKPYSTSCTKEQNIQTVTLVRVGLTPDANPRKQNAIVL